MIAALVGKTSLNYKKFKNLLGTFFPPDEIRICTPFFKTLTEKDFQSGLGEVVKFNVMFGEKGIRNIEDNIDELLKRDDDKLLQFVNSSLLFKKDFIEEDEFDRGVRIHLNFAHTFGHAFETMSHYEIPHGTAVAMGTIVANRISLSRGCWMRKRFYVWKTYFGKLFISIHYIFRLVWMILSVQSTRIKSRLEKNLQPFL